MKRITIVSLVLFVVLLTGCSNQEQTNEAMTNEEKQMADDSYTKDQMTAEEMDGEVVASEEKMMKEMKYVDISPQEAKEMIDEDPGLIVIDVSPKYAEGHIPGAINYYVGDGSLDKAIPMLDKNAKYIVYCHVDSASILGAQKLIDANFVNVYRLEGNYSSWVAAGFPVEK